MKVVYLFALLALLQGTLGEDVKFNYEDAEQKQFILGIVDGFVGVKLENCLDDITDAYNDFADGYNAFAKKDVADIKLAFEDWFSAVQALLAALKDCKSDVTAVEKTIKKVQCSIEEWSTPYVGEITEGIDILWNGYHIYKDVESCWTNYENEQYEAAGSALGDILRRCLPC